MERAGALPRGRASTAGSSVCHYLYHRSTTRIEPVCYLNDLLTAPEERGHGVGRALIEAMYEIARERGCKRVYWMTHTTNTPGRTLVRQGGAAHRLHPVHQGRVIRRLFEM